jgi:hypothetical protein
MWGELTAWIVKNMWYNNDSQIAYEYGKDTIIFLPNYYIKFHQSVGVSTVEFIFLQNSRMSPSGPSLDAIVSMAS